MKQEKYGFVYIWHDSKRKMFYIGSHWGTEDDGYVCSSNKMRNAHNRRPEKFKRKILERIYTNRKDLLETEEKWLQRVKNKNKYYNIHFTTHHWSKFESSTKSCIEKMKVSLRKTIDKMTPEERKEKFGYWKGRHNPYFSIRNKDPNIPHPRGMLGKKRSEEAKRKTSEKLKGILNPNYGKKFSEEHKQKLRDARKAFLSGGGIVWNKGLTKMTDERIKKLTGRPKINE